MKIAQKVPEFAFFSYSVFFEIWTLYNQYLSNLFIRFGDGKTLNSKNSEFGHFLGTGTFVLIKNVIRFNKIVSQCKNLNFNVLYY